MIRNIVFDMGNVLIAYDAEMFAKMHVPDEADRRTIMREMFLSYEWVQMDRGKLTPDECCKIVCAKVPERLHDAVRTLLYGWHMDSMQIPGIDALIRRLKDKGYKLYILSNVNSLFYNYCKRLAGSDCFDGMFISCEYGVVKPEAAIYTIFANKYHLQLDECVFVDDTTGNVEAAVNIGMKGIVFHGDSVELATKLSALGVDVG